MWRWLAVIWAVVSVGTVVWFARLGRLRIKYAVPTLALGLLVGALAAAPSIAQRIADALHLDTPLALVTLLVLAYASGMSLVAVRELSRLEARVRSLAEAVALLDARTHRVQESRPAEKQHGPAEKQHGPAENLQGPAEIAPRPAELGHHPGSQDPPESAPH